MDYREEKLNCPKCGSADTRLVKSVEFVNADRGIKSWPAKCYACKVIFDVDRKTAGHLSAALPPGTVVGPNVCCPNCRYDLNTQVVGGICSECGNRIPRIVQRLDASRRTFATIFPYYFIWMITAVVGAMVGHFFERWFADVVIVSGIPIFFGATAIAFGKERKLVLAHGDHFRADALDGVIRVSQWVFLFGLCLFVMVTIGIW